MMTVTQNNVYVHSSPPKAISGQGAAIRSWVRNGDLDKLESVILEGQGARLLGLMESSNDPKVKAFLKTVPSYMAKVDLIHDAVVRGSLRETQALLDKRKLAIARDAVGRGVAHKAVLYNHKSLLDWLGRKFPEVVHLRDNEGRTPLHYTAAITNASSATNTPQQANDLYSLLLTLGASPDIPDLHGKKPIYYHAHPEDLDIESPFHPHPPRSFSRNKTLSNRRISPTTPKQNTPQPPGSVTRAQIRIWIHERDIGKLEQIVWAGQGDKLLLETTNNSKVRRFLDNVPHLLGIIKGVHGVCVVGGVSGVDRLKAWRNEVGVGEVFMAKDQYGVAAVMKAIHLGHRPIVEWFAYEFPSEIKSVRDSQGRSILDYSTTPGMSSFLAKLLGESNSRGPELTELEQRRLRHLPDAPRVVGVLGEWERGELTGSGNFRREESNKSFKRKQSEDEFGMGQASESGESDEQRLSVRSSRSGGKVRRGIEDDEKVDIVDVGDGYVVDELDAVVIGEKYGLDAGNVVLEAMDFEVDMGEDEGEGNENELELEKELERITGEQEEEEEALESQEAVKEVEVDVDRKEASPPTIMSPIKTPSRTATAVKTPATPRPSTPLLNKSREPTPLVKQQSTVTLQTIPQVRPATEQLTDQVPAYNADEDDPPLPAVAKFTEKDVEQLIQDGNMESLVTLVLEGKGNLLLNSPTPSTTHPEVAEFLTNVPAYMAKIASIHSAANNGNLRDLQSLLDRKRLAQAKDEFGRVALHMAVLGGHSGVVRYLVGNYGFLDIPDSNFRTPLHYAATLADQGVIYKILIQAGADPNLKDVNDNTPGIYLRRRDLLSSQELMDFGKASDEAAVVDTWERPPSPPSVEGEEDKRLYLKSTSNEELEIDPHQLRLLDEFYSQLVSTSNESIWVKTWRKLSRKSSDGHTQYIQKYLPRELYEKIKIRTTPRFGSTLLDCLKFHPQYFLVAPDPHCYWVFRELFLGAITGVSGIDGDACGAKESLLDKLLDIKGIKNLDVAAKFIREVRIRVSRNIRPHPFVTVLRKEGLEEIANKVGRVFIDKLVGWERVDWERLMGEKEEREEREREGRGIWGGGVEPTKISRFWPKSRYIWMNPDNNAQIWIHAQDHVDFIVRGVYGKVGPLLEALKQIYDSVSGDLEYHWSSEVGYLTVNPFRCGTGMKITFRLRLPNLMSTRSTLLTLLQENSLCISTWHGKYTETSDGIVSIDSDDWVEVENVQTFGLDEVELAKRVVEGVGKVLTVEEGLGREVDVKATGGKKQ